MAAASALEATVQADEGFPRALEDTVGQLLEVQRLTLGASAARR